MEYIAYRFKLYALLIGEVIVFETKKVFDRPIVKDFEGHRWERIEKGVVEIRHFKISNTGSGFYLMTELDGREKREAISSKEMAQAITLAEAFTLIDHGGHRRVLTSELLHIEMRKIFPNW